MCEMALHVHFGGVALVGIILYWALITPSWDHILGVGMTLIRGRDFEGSQDVALINIFVNYIRTN